MALYRDEVIILSSRDVGENDRIFTLFGKRKGKFRAIAKGVRRLTSRKRGHLGTFNVCHVLCAEGRSLDILSEADSRCAIDPTTLESDEIERIGIVAMTLNKLIAEEDPDVVLYEDFERYLSGAHTSRDTNHLIVLILNRLGFLSPDQESKLPADEQKKLSVLQRYVLKILDTL